jgi:hypothetical protein
LVFNALKIISGLLGQEPIGKSFMASDHQAYKLIFNTTWVYVAL